MKSNTNLILAANTKVTQDCWDTYRSAFTIYAGTFRASHYLRAMAIWGIYGVLSDWE